MGNSLARTQLRCIFSELLTRVPDLQAGEPELLTGNFITASSGCRARSAVPSA